MIKLVISDLDGTLLKRTQNKHENSVSNLHANIVPKFNKEAIEKLTNKNIDFAIATGRMINQTTSILQNLEDVKMYKITQNGTFITDPNNQIIVQNCFSGFESNQIINTLHSFGFKPFMSSYDTLYLNEKDYESKSLEFTKMHIANNKDDLKSQIIDFKNNPLILNEDILISNFGLEARIIDFETMSQVEDVLNTELKNYATTFITSDNSMDLCPININKASAIIKLAKHLNLKLDEIAFFGDSGNDIPALQLLKHSFVMSHAKKNVLINGNYVVDSVAQGIDIILNTINNQK